MLACACGVSDAAEPVGGDPPPMPPASSRPAITPKLVIPAIDESALDDETRQRLTIMLRDALRLRDRGGRPELVRALRRLRDPALEPLFAQLSMGSDPALAAEGVLANAELDPERGLDLLVIRTQRSELARERVIRLAIDAGLLSIVQLEDVARWPELDEKVVLLASGELQKLGGKLPRTRLEAMLTSDDAITALHAAAILNTGGPGELGGVRERARGVISKRSVELQSEALAAGCERLLRQLATQQTVGGTAIAFSVYEGSRDPALKDAALISLASMTGRDAPVTSLIVERLRTVPAGEQRRAWAIAMMDAAINRTGQSERGVQDALKRDADAQVSLIGRAMSELDAGPGGEATALIALAGSRDFDAAVLALRGASQRPWQQAVDIRLAAALAAETSTDMGVLLLSEAAVSELCDDDAALVLPLVKRAIDGKSMLLQRAVLAGALRSGQDGCVQIAQAMLARVTELEPGARALAELLMARHASLDESTPALAKELAQTAIARTELPTVWRAQAAWLALRVAGEDRAALARVLASIDAGAPRRDAPAPAMPTGGPALP